MEILQKLLLLKVFFSEVKKKQKQNKNKNAITFFVTVLFNILMKKNNDFWRLHKNMNCAFPLRRLGSKKAINNNKIIVTRPSCAILVTILLRYTRNSWNISHVVRNFCVVLSCELVSHKYLGDIFSWIRSYLHGKTKDLTKFIKFEKLIDKIYSCFQIILN